MLKYKKQFIFIMENIKKEESLDFIKSIIENYNSKSAHTFKNHLFKLAKNEYLKNYSEFQKNNNIDLEAREIALLKKCVRISTNYSNHKQLFKQAFHSKNPLFYFKPLKTESLEDMEDGILKIIHNNKVKNYAHSFLRSYKNLLNENSYQLFDEIMNRNLEREYIQNEIRKVASFKNSQDLNQTLKKIVNNEHSVDYIVKKIEENNLDVDILFKNEKQIVLNINDFEASSFLGSNQWCISYDENYFEEYLYKNQDEDENEQKGHQLFLYDFSKDPENIYYMIGITVSSNGTIITAHDKNDNDITESIQALFEINNNNELILKNNHKQSQSSNHINEDITFNLNEIFKQLPYNYEESLSYYKRTELYEVLEDNKILTLSSRYPLATFLHIKNKKSNQLNTALNEAAQINFEETIIENTLYNHFIYHDFSNQEMAKMLIKSFFIIDELNQFQQILENSCENEDFDDDIDFDDCKNNKNIEIGFSIYNYSTFHLVEKFFKNLNDIEKTMIYKDNEDNIIKLLERHAENCCTHQSNDLSKSTRHLPHDFNNNSFSMFYSNAINYINKNPESSLASYKPLFVLNTLLEKQTKEHLADNLIEYIKNKTININKIMKNLSQFSDNTLEKIAALLNEQPEFLSHINNEIVQNIGVNDYFLEKLEPETCKTLNNFAKQNKINFGKLNEVNFIFMERQKFDLPERLKKLKDKNIIDDEIIERHYDKSTVTFGNRKNESLFFNEKEIKKPMKLKNI